MARSQVDRVFMTKGMTNAEALLLSRLHDGNYLNYVYGSNPSSGFIITVSLRYTYDISLIRVINRHDCCQDSLKGFTVFIVGPNGDEIECGLIDEAKSDYGFWIEGTGNEVELRKEGNAGTVHLAEVEVYGSAAGQNYILYPLVYTLHEL